MFSASLTMSPIRTVDGEIGGVSMVVRDVMDPPWVTLIVDLDSNRSVGFIGLASGRSGYPRRAGCSYRARSFRMVSLPWRSDHLLCMHQGSGTRNRSLGPANDFASRASRPLPCDYPVRELWLYAIGIVGRGLRRTAEECGFGMSVAWLRTRRLPSQWSSSGAGTGLDMK